MFISRKLSMENIVDIYTDMTRTYLRSIKDVVSDTDLKKFNNSTFLITEGYRHSLCVLFQLETEASLALAKKYESAFVEVLRPVYDKYNLEKLSSEKKKGLLEACIHCIEMTRKVVS